MTAKKILITGASSGIGAALAREFAGRGAHLGLLARRADELKKLVEELQAQFPRQILCYRPADVRDEAQLEAAVHSLIDEMGGLDVAVANSGIGETRSAYSLHLWQLARDTLAVNLLGAIHTLELAKQFFVEQRIEGQLVGISSIAAVRGFPKGAAYCASKAGLSTYLESLRGELEHAGIDVISIHPGYIRTPLTSKNSRMPWLMEVGPAAVKIADAIEAGKRRYVFPAPMRVVFGVMKYLPDFAYDFFAYRQSKPKNIVKK